MAAIAAMAMWVQFAAAQSAPKTLNAVREQVGQSAKASPAAAKPASSGSVAPASAAAPKATATAAPTASAAAVEPQKAAPKPSAAAAGPRRDPFSPLFGGNSNQGRASGPASLPPGKAGLTVGTLRLDGLVNGPNGMIAVVSNPQQRVYFLHEGDRIFDGQVTRITMEAVSFRQTGSDPFGNSLEHEVTRRLYATPGEQR
jgi:hypothetical protein